MSKRVRRNGEGSIYPYKNGYAAYVWVTKPDGTRGRKYVYGKTRDEVHDKWIKLHQKAKQGPVATKVPRIAEYAPYWLREIIKPNLAPGSYVNYEVVTRLYIVPGLGRRGVDKLRIQHAQKWINQVAETCQCCAHGKDARRREGKRRCCAIGRCCQDLPSPTSLGHYRTVLRTMLSQAILDELITFNVAEHLKLPSARGHKRKSWASKEACRFLESARRDDDPLYAAYVLLLVLGLRKGELLGIVWDAIDWDGWDQPCAKHDEPGCAKCIDKHEITLQVEFQLQRVSKELLHRETKTPTSDARLPLPALCALALWHHRQEQDKARQGAGAAWQNTGFVFTTALGTPIEPRNFNRYWDRRIMASGVVRITIRDARRTCGSLLADLGVHPRIAMRILRHANFSITMEIYTQVTTKATRKALKRLGKRLG